MPLFLTLMALASAISLLRGFAVAGLLDAASFGVYAAVFAAGTFGSLLVSGGRVELTQKTYPRLWSDGQHAALLGLADRGARTLVLRAAVVDCLLQAGNIERMVARRRSELVTFRSRLNQLLLQSVHRSAGGDHGADAREKLPDEMRFRIVGRRTR